MAVLIVFSGYYRPAQNKNQNHNRSSSSSDTNHISDDIKNIQTGGSGGPAAIIGAGGEEAVVAEPYPEEEEEEENESTPMKALNNKGRIASTSGSKQANGESNKRTAFFYVNKSICLTLSSFLKKIPKAVIIIF
jgi:hypothetical protein